MDLATHQRALQQLLKGRPCSAADDPYVKSVAASEGLALLREVALWWKRRALEQGCPLTSRLLKQCGTFESAVESYVRERHVSPFVEQCSEDFLVYLGAADASLIAAVARSEYALVRVMRGDRQEYRICWPCDPEPVLSRLLAGQPVETKVELVPYVATVSQQLANLVAFAPSNVTTRD